MPPGAVRRPSNALEPQGPGDRPAWPWFGRRRVAPSCRHSCHDAVAGRGRLPVDRGERGIRLALLDLRCHLAAPSSRSRRLGPAEPERRVPARPVCAASPVRWPRRHAVDAGVRPRCPRAGVGSSPLRSAGCRPAGDDGLASAWAAGCISPLVGPRRDQSSLDAGGESRHADGRRGRILVRVGRGGPDWDTVA